MATLVPLSRSFFLGVAILLGGPYAYLILYKGQWPSLSISVLTPNYF